MADTLFQNTTANQQGTVVVADWLNDVDKATYNTLSAVAGTNTITANGPQPLATGGYTTGLKFFFVPQNTNTGAVTINLSGLGAKSIVRGAGNALLPGDLVVGVAAFIYYDGTQFQLQNPQAVLNLPVGNCRFVFTNASTCTLIPFGGNKLTINGIPQTIPSAGVTLAVGGLAPLTVYYVYAFMNAGVMTLEASATTHATDSTTGVEIKNADPSRTLVGMVRPVLGPIFMDSAAYRGVIGWFNRRRKVSLFPLGGNVAFNNTTLSVGAAGWRAEYLCWSGDPVDTSMQGTSVAGSTVDVFTFGVVSNSVISDFHCAYMHLGGGSFTAWMNSYVVDNFSEGYNYSEPWFRSSGGGVTNLQGTGGAGLRCYVRAVVLG